ncbi:hypothetical protein DSM112329_00185 [Paraconexibacter sp. AEG42_29]|uniref:Uncharacterized protein n=1 Tax=Paraconexibacter sp. AEG42_29 TaxID=2997339 RepID=A0AAU7ANZ3_9ACTN
MRDTSEMAEVLDELRSRIQAYNATCDLINAGRAIVGPTDGEAPLLEADRLRVVAALAACEEAGYTSAELDLVLAEANASSVSPSPSAS